jgi:hypothetical protein
MRGVWVRHVYETEAFMLENRVTRAREIKKLIANHEIPSPDQVMQ